MNADIKDDVRLFRMLDSPDIDRLCYIVDKELLYRVKVKHYYVQLWC